jgi:hypothetical protein
VTPFLSGGSLDVLLKQDRKGQAPGEWTGTQKHKVLLGIASAMMFMHEHRLIHRDLKPANVLLNENLEPKDADFGLSKIIPVGQTVGQSMTGGTAPFMAPEIFAGEGYDFTVDVYAYGILMYVVVTGLEPFNDSTNQFVIAGKVQGGYRPPIPRSINAGYRSLIQRCWSHSPRERPSFREIVYLLGQQDCLRGTIIEEFRGYQMRIVPEDLIAKTPVAFAEEATAAFLNAQSRSLEPGPIKILRELADEGNPFGLVQYAHAYEKGDGVPESKEIAANLFKQAADQNDPSGLVEFALCLQEGKGVLKDLAEAARYCKRAVDLGDPEAIYVYARMLRYANGVNRDFRESARMFRVAADAGHGLAAEQYADLVEQGLAAEDDPAIAIRYYKMSSDCGCPDGQRAYADMLRKGRLVPKNLTESVRVYQQIGRAHV